MTDENSTQVPPSGRRWLRLLAVVVGGLLVLLVVLYFVVSSSAFLRGVVLPRVGKSLHADISVADASLSPFSQLTLHRLKVQPIGAEPLLTADEVKVRYSLLSILRGNYVVDELTLISPTVDIIKQPNGSSNFDPLNNQAPSKSSSASSSGPLHLALHDITFKNATVRLVTRGPGAAVQSTQIGPLDLTLDRVENGQPGKLTLGTAFHVENQVPPGQSLTNGLLEGKLNGTFAFNLDRALLPKSVTGTSRAEMVRAEGGFAELAGLAASLQTELTPTDLRQFVLGFERGGRGLGRIQATGPLDLSRKEGRVTLAVQDIDRQVLNLFGAAHGWDFGPSTLNATNYLDLAKAGDVIGAKGRVVAHQISIQEKGQATPPLDLDINYEVSVNRPEQTAIVSTFTIAGLQQQKDLLMASLDRPMTLSWGSNGRGMAQSQFQLTVAQFNLDDWRPVLGTNLPSGRVDVQLGITARADGKQLALKGTVGLQDLTGQLGTNRLEHAQAALAADATLENFALLRLNQLQIDAQQGNTQLFKASASGNVDLARHDMTVQATAEVAMPGVLASFPVPQLTAAQGVVRLSASVRQKGSKQSLTGNVALGDFTGDYGSYRFANFQAALDYNLDVERPSVQIHSAALSLHQGYTDGGSITLSGSYDLEKRAGQGDLKLVDLNQNALEPILTPSLGDKKLVSISINGSASAAYDPKGSTGIKADLSLTNWVVSNPKEHFTSPNLSVRTKLDGSFQQQVIDLRQFLLGLSPTAQAKNELNVTAHLDLGKTNPTPSQLDIQAESLDLTPYYDLFAGNKQTNAAPAKPAPQPAPGAPATPAEPGPANLPFQQLTAALKVGRLYLRQVAVTNLQTTVKINQGQVTVQPLELTLNGAAVKGNATLNLAVAGYKYDLAFNADRVPMEPLANSFTTNSPGQYKGDLFAQLHLAGAGMTGPSLQKNLSGDLSLNMTNMNYEIISPKTKRLIEPVALVLRVPELSQTPLTLIMAKAQVGQGQIQLQKFTVESQAFHADSQGTVPMASELTNSPLKLPVTLSLRRSLAEKANLLAANTPTNATFVALPAFVTLTGTLGEPKTEINKLVIGGLLARSLGGIPQLGDKAGTVLQGVGGFLAGQGGTVSTNKAAGTNAAPANQLIDTIGGLLSQPKKDRVATNAPKSSVPATNKPANPSISDLLKLIPEKK